MQHEYTRQRQGRDFCLHDYLTETAAANCANDIININADNDRKTLAERIKQYRADAERSAVPVDGREPPERVGR